MRAKKYTSPQEAVESAETLTEALEAVDHRMIGDGGGPTFDQEVGADHMRDVCIEVVRLWQEKASRVEAHVKEHRPAGRGSSTVTESLLQGVGAWDALIETERLLFSEEE